MLHVSLDTSFLISFADPDRPHHSVAVDYFRHCLARHIPMWISTVAAGEFEVRQSIADLPLQNFRILPYNLPHAIRSAALFRALREDNTEAGQDRRPLIINDLKILAQAEEERIPVILTEDENTLFRIASRLSRNGVASVRVALLREGFVPGKLENSVQGEFPLSPPEA